MGRHMSGAVGRRAIELGYASAWQIREAYKFQQLARMYSGLDLGVGEALYWQGVLDPKQLDRLLGEVGSEEDVARDCFGRLHFGQVALARRLVTPAQLDECLEIQREEDVAGKEHRLIGQILLERGYMTRAGVAAVVDSLVERGLRGRRAKPGLRRGRDRRAERDEE